MLSEKLRKKPVEIEAFQHTLWNDQPRWPDWFVALEAAGKVTAAAFGDLLTDVFADHMGKHFANSPQARALPLPAPTVTDAMVEAAAKRICGADGQDWDVLEKTYNGRQRLNDYKRFAFAALTAALAAQEK